MAKSRSSGLGSNPLSAADAFLDDIPEDEGTASTPRRSARRRAKSNGATRLRPPKRKKVRGTFQMEEDLLQRARDAVVALSGPPHRMTLAGLVEGALTRELARLEKKHNDGDPFPKADAPLRQGRPIGS